MNHPPLRHCVPCRHGTPPLEGAALAALRATLDPAWDVVEERRLVRRIATRDFAGALALAQRVGELAEREQHHPDLLVRWGELSITLWTHTVGGLSENDFILAAWIDALLATPGALESNAAQG